MPNRWRFIDLQKNSAKMNMALDQALYESALQTQKPSIRFYQWEKPALSLGAYQAITDINLAFCKEHNLDLVRRMTGGRAVYHSPKDFTYCVVVPIRQFDYSISTAYRSICNSIVIALKRLGIKGQIAERNDVVVGNKKISGNAAKVMDEGWYLQHGTIHYENNNDFLSRLFSHPLKDFEDHTTAILDHKNASFEDVHQALIEGFTKEKDIEFSHFSMQEIARAEELVSIKYASVMPADGSFTKSRGACSLPTRRDHFSEDDD